MEVADNGRNKLELGDPAPPDRSLGCYQRKFDITLDNGAKATAIEYDMREFLKECVSHYVKVTGCDPKTLRTVDTPFIQAPPGGGDTPAAAEPNEQRGALTDVACTVLMKVLYAARVARWDLL